jgi:hypothetical protein
VELDGVDAGIAVTHNASQNGLLIVTKAHAKIGMAITVSFENIENVVPTKVKGRVVRVGRNEEDPDGLWPYALGVEFDEPLLDVELLRRVLEGDD